MIKNIKEIHPKDLCMFKIGNFYHTYGRDSYILSYIMGYKVKETSDGYKECGFPINATGKVLSNLENYKINYVLLDRRNNYRVDEKMTFKNLNNYSKIYEKAKKYINYSIRIENINKFLQNNINEKDFNIILGEMEDVIINERRKI